MRGEVKVLKGGRGQKATLGRLDSDEKKKVTVLRKKNK